MAKTQENIAIIFARQNKHQEATQMFHKVLATKEKVLGPDHLDVANTQRNMGGVYQNQAKYPAALEMFQKSLATEEKLLGLEHPDLAKTKVRTCLGLIRVLRDDVCL